MLACPLKTQPTVFGLAPANWTGGFEPLASGKESTRDRVFCLDQFFCRGARQERAGIDIVSDGEQRRKSYLTHITMQLEGIDYEKLDKAFQKWVDNLR